MIAVFIGDTDMVHISWQGRPAVEETDTKTGRDVLNALTNEQEFPVNVKAEDGTEGFRLERRRVANEFELMMLCSQLPRLLGQRSARVVHLTEP